MALVFSCQPVKGVNKCYPNLIRHQRPCAPIPWRPVSGVAVGLTKLPCAEACMSLIPLPPSYIYFSTFLSYLARITVISGMVSFCIFLSLRREEGAIEKEMVFQILRNLLTFLWTLGWPMAKSVLPGGTIQIPIITGRPFISTHCSSIRHPGRNPVFISAWVGLTCTFPCTSFILDDDFHTQ